MATLVGEMAAAEILCLSVRTLRKWRWDGNGPGFIKLGKAVRYSTDDLRAFVEAGKRRSTSDSGVEGDVAHA